MKTSDPDERNRDAILLATASYMHADYWPSEAIVDVMLVRSEDLLSRYRDQGGNRRMLVQIVEDARRAPKQPDIPAPAPPKPKGPKGGGAPPGMGM